MSSEPEEIPRPPTRPQLGTPKSEPRHLAKSIVGIVCSRREAATEILPALQLLRSFHVCSSIFVMPTTGIGSFDEWARQLRRSGGVALWALVSGDLEIVHKASSVDTDLPLFCQAVGPNADELQTGLIPRMRELSAALLYARRLHEAAFTIARVAAIADPYVETRLKQYRNSEVAKAASRSDRIANQPGVLDFPKGFVHEVTLDMKPGAPEYVELQATEEMKPRIVSKTEKPKQAKAAKAFDYSVQLRQVLSSAKEIAAAYRNPQVAPEHLLAAIIDTPGSAAHQLLVGSGVNLEALAGHLMPHFPPPHEPEVQGMFSMADSTWTVLENARSIARERQRPCLTTLDFLESIALRTSSGATSALWETGLLATQLDEAIGKADAAHEYASIKPKHEEPEPTGIDPQQAREVQARLDKGEAPESAPSTVQGFSPEPEPEPQIVHCDPANPELEVVETVADALLEGRLVAFPMDTMFALVADATNEAAVQRLRATIQSDTSRHLGALIHSTTQLKHLVKTVSGAVMKMLDDLWPGPLTVVFDRHPHRFAHLSSEPTLGLRIPNDYLSLAILSTAGRPLAATSIRLEEGEGARHAAKKLAGVVDVVVDTGELPGDAMTTIVSVAEGGPKLLRDGATDVKRIEQHVGKLKES
ncbi:MAG: L-threonylcarbamoyladenylate synthase [Candidatus Sumerlaeaceae bacterium]